MTLNASSNQATSTNHLSSSFLERRISDPSPSNAFVNFVNRQKKKYEGRDGQNVKRPFIPRDALDGYWAKPVNRVREACESYSPSIFRTSATNIRETYLRVFSTLVYAGVLSFLPDFLEHGLTDDHFPRHDLPGCWTDCPPQKDMFNKFKEHQWTFFPVILDSKQLATRRLPDERILPISTKERVRTSDATIIYKVQFHQSCIQNCHGSDDANKDGIYALKTYRGERYKKQWDTELRAYNALQGNNDNNVVKCFGTFIHGDTFNLVLQWIDGPNLLEFLLGNPKPTCALDTLDFWSSLAEIFTGLHHLHQFAMDNDNNPTLQLVHQDIKLDNIILELSTNGRFSFTPYIADFGCSHYGHVSSLVIDLGGNQMYSAPEAIRDSGARWAGTSHLRGDADIFAMGAVLSDVATWLAFGQDGRREYLSERCREIQRHPDINRSGYEGTFHNGAGPLKCVAAMHKRIRQSLPPWDVITPKVLVVIDSHMLTASNRENAKFLNFTLKRELEELRRNRIPQTPRSTIDIKRHESEAASDCEGFSTPPSPIVNLPHTTQSIDTGFPASPEIMLDTHYSFQVMDSVHPPPIREVTETMLAAHHDGNSPKARSMPSTPVAGQSSIGPSLLDSPPFTRRRSVSGASLSMKAAQAYWSDKKHKRPADPTSEAIIEQLRSNLGNRDYIFLVDDTDTMRKHLLLPPADPAFTLLAYIAKKFDPDNLELVFASHPFNIITKKHSTPLVKALKEHTFQAYPGTMETGLGILINHKIIPRLPKRIGGKMISWKGGKPKPMTIFVFTDGQWGPGVQLGNRLDEPITTLIDKMKSRGLVRTQVMIQFIRFGDDAEGKAHLEYLDQFGKDQHFDVVDTRNSRDDVSSMFLASFTQANDDCHSTACSFAALPPFGSTANYSKPSNS